MKGRSWGAPLYGNVGAIQSNMVLPYGMPVKPSDMKPVEDVSRKVDVDFLTSKTNLKSEAKPNKSILTSMGFVDISNQLQSRNKFLAYRRDSSLVITDVDEKPIYETMIKKDASCCVCAPSVGRLSIHMQSVQPGAFGLQPCIELCKQSQCFNMCGCMGYPDIDIKLVERSKSNISIGSIAQKASSFGRCVIRQSHRYL